MAKANDPKPVVAPVVPAEATTTGPTTQPTTPVVKAKRKRAPRDPNNPKSFGVTLKDSSRTMRITASSAKDGSARSRATIIGPKIPDPEKPGKFTRERQIGARTGGTHVVLDGNGAIDPKASLAEANERVKKIQTVAEANGWKIGRGGAGSRARTDAFGEDSLPAAL